MSAREERVREATANGKAALSKAKAAVKTGLFNWTANWEKAGRYYKEAAKCFRLGGEETAQLLLESFEGLAKAEQKCNNIFHAGKALEDAAAAMMRLKNHKLALQAYEGAARMYATSTELQDKGANAYIRAAGMAEEQKDRIKALELYTKGCKLYEECGKGVFFCEKHFNVSICCAVDTGRFTQGLQLIRDLSQMYIAEADKDDVGLYQCMLSELALLLRLSKYGEAVQAYVSDCKTLAFQSSRHAKAAYAVMHAVVTANATDFRQALRRSLRFMNPSVAQQAITLGLDPVAAAAIKSSQDLPKPLATCDSDSLQSLDAVLHGGAAPASSPQAVGSAEDVMDTEGTGADDGEPDFC